MTDKLSPRYAVQNRVCWKAISLLLVPAFLFGPLLGLLGFQATPTEADGWVIECVDCPPLLFSDMTDRSLQLDVAGHPHIAYGGEERLYYAWHDGARWHYEIVDDFPDVHLRGASLALDKNGHPHISYRYYNYDSSSASLKYACRDSLGWHIEVVDSGTLYIGEYTSLALEGGYPHISYRDSYNDDLKHAYRDAFGWHIETVDNEGDVGLYASLALDGNGYPHISYYDVDNADLKYAYQDASGWHLKTVESEGYTGWYTSLALDAGGYPHISYRYQATGDPTPSRGLKYGYQDSAGWHFEKVDAEGNVGEYTSLALDADGYPHISYYDDINGNLKYAYQDAASWHIETVDDSGVIVGEYSSLALDASGYAHISYYDAWHDLYSDNKDLKYAYQDGSGWHIETVDREGDVGLCTSLALDGNGHPHISYYDSAPNGDLKYAYWNGSGWHIETVDSEGNAGLYTSLALNRNGYVHISYYYCGDPWPCDVGDLMYAYQDTVGWHVEIVDSEGDVGKYTSLALDGSGYPRISYYDNTHGDLKYAYRDASGWHTEIVDSGGWVGLDTSLILDNDGYPHIGYNDGYPASDLKYAYQDATGWHTETVDSEGDVGRYTSLALDKNGHPHISYYDRSNGHLKYAYYSAAPVGRLLYLPLVAQN
ncbi:MAG: carboxypeptidase regulatory-like domain-containing protein [Chloroflexi bacterium]|nr:carboxypeptidase regulatory-like domain-containing protein [Chloroflexota bacterium]